MVNMRQKEMQTKMVLNGPTVSEEQLAMTWLGGYVPREYIYLEPVVIQKSLVEEEFFSSSSARDMSSFCVDNPAVVPRESAVCSDPRRVVGGSLER
jgi:hypothetical protein